MEKFKAILKKGFKRYGLDALSAMALGLFASLIIGLIPVSYTHLDVYKRQSLYLDYG